jgi:hypothetical protein
MKSRSDWPEAVIELELEELEDWPGAVDAQTANASSTRIE